MEKEIEEYIIVKKETTDITSSEVTRKLKDGYRLYGNPFMIGSYSCQAMIKYKEEYSKILND